MIGPIQEVKSGKDETRGKFRSKNQTNRITRTRKPKNGEINPGNKPMENSNSKIK